MFCPNCKKRKNNNNDGFIEAIATASPLLERVMKSISRPRENEFRFKYHLRKLWYYDHKPFSIGFMIARSKEFPNCFNCSYNLGRKCLKRSKYAVTVCTQVCDLWEEKEGGLEWTASKSETKHE